MKLIAAKISTLFALGAILVAPSVSLGQLSGVDRGGDSPQDEARGAQGGGSSDTNDNGDTTEVVYCKKNGTSAHYAEFIRRGLLAGRNNADCFFTAHMSGCLGPGFTYVHQQRVPATSANQRSALGFFFLVNMLLCISYHGVAYFLPCYSFSLNAQRHRLSCGCFACLVV